MKNWERALTICMALAAIACTLAVMISCARLLSPEGALRARDGAFFWSSSAYQISGSISGGMLEELRILRTGE